MKKFLKTLAKLFTVFYKAKQANSHCGCCNLDEVEQDSNTLMQKNINLVLDYDKTEFGEKILVTTKYFDVILDGKDFPTWTGTVLFEAPRSENSIPMKVFLIDENDIVKEIITEGTLYI